MRGCSHKVREIEKGERERVCGSKKERERDKTAEWGQ